MYYFIPKRAQRTGLFRYRLSIVHILVVIFNLHLGGAAPPATYTALPQMAQTLGHDLSLFMLWNAKLGG